MYLVVRTMSSAFNLYIVLILLMLYDKDNLLSIY